MPSLKDFESRLPSAVMPDRTYLSNQMKELRIRHCCVLADVGEDEDETRRALCRLRVLTGRVP